MIVIWMPLPSHASTNKDTIEISSYTVCETTLCLDIYNLCFLPSVHDLPCIFPFLFLFTIISRFNADFFTGWQLTDICIINIVIFNTINPKYQLYSLLWWYTMQDKTEWSKPLNIIYVWLWMYVIVINVMFMLFMTVCIWVTDM